MSAQPEMCSCGHHRATHVWHWGPPKAYCAAGTLGYGGRCGCDRFAGVYALSDTPQVAEGEQP